MAVRDGSDGTDAALRVSAFRMRASASTILGLEGPAIRPAAGEGLGEDPASSKPDVHILEIAYDSAEERYRTYESAVNAYFDDDFRDRPLEGLRSTLTVIRQLRRDGRCFFAASR